MTRALALIAALGIFGIGAQAFAADSMKQPTLSKHQMIVLMNDCMKKRMWADQKIFYNEAARACKAQLTHGSGATASGALVASDNPPKR